MPKLKIAPSTMRTTISLWIRYAKEKWYWAFIVGFYKLGEDALLGWINNQWGVAMTYLNYIPPATGYFLIPLIFIILLFRTARQVSTEIERRGGFVPIDRPEASIQSDDARTVPKTENRDQQRDSRRVVETNVNKSQIEISFVMGTGNQSICAKFTNLTPLPFTNCKYSVSNLQRWSDIQKTYLVRSISFEPFYFPGLITLEPEIPAGFEIFSMRMGCLFFTGRRNNIIANHNESAESGTTWRLVVSASSDDKVINEKRVYFKVIGKNELGLVSDPEAATDL